MPLLLYASHPLPRVLARDVAMGCLCDDAIFDDAIFDDAIFDAE